ncbi:MAG: hypothetical protein ABSH48_07750 [Verrucomicrobiota bacterium]|jgi:hypothetical protein
MPETVQTTIAKLFQDDKPAAPSRLFSWRLIQRRQLPFLLLPIAPANPRVSLALYSAQRRRAKIWRAALPLVLGTPAAAVFHRIDFQASGASRMIRFLSDQSGVPVDLLPTPAIKFGGLACERSRLVLLVCDQTNRPIKVVKIGLDAVGRATTEREADLLEMLPANMLGGVRITGRIATPMLSAFATDYFPGDSPENDLGMEILFHAWINPGPAIPLESLEIWRLLDAQAADAAPAAWRALRPALAGRSLRTTLYHGDFAPWNIRAVNSRQLQAFDWERAHLQGIPGWDWFHFVVQTSILARRHSVERVAAELEDLLQSPRFQKYAEDAGIQATIKPLALAYLLHHRWVFKPLDGLQRVEELFELLSERWGFLPPPDHRGAPARARVLVPASPAPGLWADALVQLKSAWSQLANVFWEPQLIAVKQPSRSVLSKYAVILFCSAWLAGSAGLQYFYARHVSLLPVFAVPCLLASWRINRNWGTLFAVAAAVAGPLIAAAKDPGIRVAGLLWWNGMTRFIILQMCVFLADRIHQQQDFFDELVLPRSRPANFRRNWAILLVSALWFFAIAWGDIRTGPRVSFLALYLFPAMLVTLFLNLGWGAFMALLGALVASIDEYASHYNVSLLKVFLWNFPMRFLMLFVVILLLNRLRHDNVLFGARGSDEGSRSPNSSKNGPV